MSSPLGADTSALTQALVENASRLGLVWRRRLATVVDGSDPVAVTAVFDGDTATIGMTSMIGSLVQDQRVYVDIIPPSGNFIVGRVGRYEARQTLSTTAASVTFSNIPPGLRSLRLDYVVRADNAVNVQLTLIQFDADTSAIYYYEVGQFTNVTTTAVPASAQTSGGIGLCTGASAPSGRFATGQVAIAGWDNTVTTALGWTFLSQALGTLVANFTAQTGGGLYESAGPHSSITILPQAGNFIAGSDFQLVGEPS